MAETPTYGSGFYSRIADGSMLSARQVVPTLMELLKPTSVVDVGCGTGAWLSAFRENGVTDIFGVDGDYVDRKVLLIPQEGFRAADLSRPLNLDRRFDLAISVEVAEHLPAAAAETFVQSLTGLSDLIVFSAAIPLQGGAHHVNEQWPEYWQHLFDARGYQVVDGLRPRFWNNDDVEPWYRQNLLLYVNKNQLAALPQELQKIAQGPQMLAVVHPSVYLTPSVSGLRQMIPRTIASRLRRVLKR